MTIIYSVDWESGSQSGTTYTQATPEIPNGGTLALNRGGAGQVFQENDPPWNGAWLCDISTYWDQSASDTLSSSTWSNNSGRILFQMTMPNGTDDVEFFHCNYNNENGNRLAVYWIYNTGSPYFRAYYARDGWTAEADLTFSPGSAPTVPQNIEVIYDPNNATASLRLRMRYWDVGGSPGSFTNVGTTYGSAGTPANQFVNAAWGPQGITGGTLMVGRIIHSDDISEDLSPYVTTSTGIPFGWIRA